jgi:rod shape-determining protein MreD
VYLVLAAALFLHMTVLDRIRILGARPDITLMCVVFFGIFSSPRMGLEAGCVAGLFTDIFAFGPFGINTILYALTGFLAGAFSSKVFKESSAIQFIMVFFFQVFSMALHFILASALSKTLYMTFADYFLSSVLPTGIYTSTVSLALFPAFMRLFGLRREEEFLW